MLTDFLMRILSIALLITIYNLPRNQQFQLGYNRDLVHFISASEGKCSEKKCKQSRNLTLQSE